MKMSLINDELRIKFPSDADEIVALIKALKIFEELMEKKAKVSKEQLSAAVTMCDNSPLSFRDLTYAVDNYKEKQESLTEIRNLIKFYSDDLNLVT